MRTRTGREFDDLSSRAVRASAVAAAGLAGDDLSTLDSDYRSAVRSVLSILAVFMLEPLGVPEWTETCRVLRETAEGKHPWHSAQSTLSILSRSTRLDLLKQDRQPPAKYARDALRILLSTDEPALEFDEPNIFPSSLLSPLYEHLLTLQPQPSDEPPGVALLHNPGTRKRSGSFFTPPFIIDYIVRQAVSRFKDSAPIRILDPSMGAGDFLIRSFEFLVQQGRDAVDAAENCLYGCDIDPIAVDVSRFLVWLAAGGKADARAIARHLVCADALADEKSFRWQDAFPDAFLLFPAGPGFDAVIGNPPYVAAKNGALENYRKGRAVRGQSDYYLMFLESVIGNQLVHPDGVLAMVLPDPFLVRENAAHVRRELLEAWTVESVVHVAGAFPSAQVANIVLTCSNHRSDGGEFPVIRLDKGRLRRRFEQDPDSTFSEIAYKVSPSFALSQPRAEVLYLAEDERWRGIFERIHGQARSLTDIIPPFDFLENLPVEVIFRGEEIGKQAILDSKGDLPILLGGQSVRRYRINREGHGISRDAVSKPIEWYEGEKIVLQKSSARLIAAFDTRGIIIPQSVYGIKLERSSYSPLYLLALLNSRFLSDYVFRAFTGYKLVQPQIELEDIRRLPIRTMPFNLDPETRARLTDEGRRAFEVELSAGHGDFPELKALIDSWIASGSEDAVHDLLVHLAGLAVSSKNELNAGDLIDRAIDIIAARLYC